MVTDHETSVPLFIYVGLMLDKKNSTYDIFIGPVKFTVVGSQYSPLFNCMNACMYIHNV